MEFKKSIIFEIKIDINLMYNIIKEDIQNKHYCIKKDYSIKDFLNNFIFCDAEFLCECDFFQDYIIANEFLKNYKNDLLQELLKKFKEDNISIIKTNIEIAPYENIINKLKVFFSQQKLYWHDEEDKQKIKEILLEMLKEE